MTERLSVGFAVRTAWACWRWHVGKLPRNVAGLGHHFQASEGKMAVAFMEGLKLVLFSPEGKNGRVGRADCCIGWKEVGVARFLVKRR